MPMHEPHLFQHDTAEGERGGTRSIGQLCNEIPLGDMSGTTANMAAHSEDDQAL